MSAIPPLGDIAPGLECSRWMGNHNCGRAGIWHIFWTADGENSIACDAHMLEALERWAPVTSHLYDPICSIPGAAVVMPDDGPSYCYVPDEGSEVEAAASCHLPEAVTV